MSWEDDTVRALRRNDVEVIAYLPDSISANLIERVDQSNDFTTIRVAREEEAIGVLGGTWLGGKRGALICQSSGMANCFNALGSYAIPNSLPFVGLVTRRGNLGEHNFAQIPAGYGMPRLLDDLGVRNQSLDAGDPVGETVERAVKTAVSTGQPYVLLLERNLTGGKDD